MSATSDPPRFRFAFAHIGQRSLWETHGCDLRKLSVQDLSMYIKMALAEKELKNVIRS